MRRIVNALLCLALLGPTLSTAEPATGEPPAEAAAAAPRPPANPSGKEVLSALEYRRLSFIPYAKVWEIEDRPADQQLDFGRGPSNFYAFEFPKTPAPYTLRFDAEMTSDLAAKEVRLMEPWIFLFDESFELLDVAEPGERFQNGMSFMVRVPASIKVPETARYMLITADPTRVGDFFIIDYAVTTTIGYASYTTYHKAEVEYATQGKVRFQMPAKRPSKEPEKRRR